MIMKTRIARTMTVIEARSDSTEDHDMETPRAEDDPVNVVLPLIWDGEGNMMIEPAGNMLEVKNPGDVAIPAGKYCVIAWSKDDESDDESDGESDGAWFIISVEC